MPLPITRLILLLLLVAAAASYIVHASEPPADTAQLAQAWAAALHVDTNTAACACSRGHHDRALFTHCYWACTLADASGRSDVPLLQLLGKHFKVCTVSLITGEAYLQGAAVMVHSYSPPPPPPHHRHPGLVRDTARVPAAARVSPLTQALAAGTFQPATCFRCCISHTTSRATPCSCCRHKVTPPCPRPSPSSTLTLFHRPPPLHS